MAGERGRRSFEMALVLTPKIGLSRNVPRIWIEGQALKNEGIKPRMPYNLKIIDKKIILEFNGQPNGDALKTGSVSVRTITKNDGNIIELPLIEIRMLEIFQVLGENIDRAKVTVCKSKIVIQARDVIEKIAARSERLKNKIKNGIPLAIGSLFHGGGVMDSAFHHGLKSAGIDSFVKVAVELENKYLDSSVRNNPELFNSESILIQSEIEDLNFYKKNAPELDVVVAGIPCVGASVSGRSKNKLTCAEEHGSAGSLFFYFLSFVLAVNPAIVVIENVKQYMNTISMMVIRSVLSAQGYTIKEQVLSGAEFGAIEDRERMCAVAYSGDYGDDFNFDSIERKPLQEKCVRDVLENIPLDSERYKTFSYLIEKEKKDIEAGKGFTRQIITGESKIVGCIGKGYAKCRSTEPFFQHPENPSLMRIFSKNEHARLKTIPEHIIDGCSETTAHEIMGQSVIYQKIKSLAQAIGNFIK